MLWASLVSAIRDFRTPLIAGLIWLLAAWAIATLWFNGTTINSKTGADALKAEFGPIAVAAVIGMLAYLLGSITESIPHVLVLFSYLPYYRRSPLAARLIVGLLPRKFGISNRAEKTIFNYIRRRLREFGELLEKHGLFLDVADVLPLLNDALVLMFITQIADAIGAPSNQEDFSKPKPSPQVLATRIAPVPRVLGFDHSSVEYVAVMQLTFQVYSEFDLLPSRMIGNEAELFTEVDRLRSEAEFRLATVPPLIIATSAIAVRVNILLLAAIPALVIFYLSGIRRRREAGELLADIVATGRVETVVLQRLKAVVDEKIAATRAPAEAEIVRTTIRKRLKRVSESARILKDLLMFFNQDPEGTVAFFNLFAKGKAADDKVATASEPTSSGTTLSATRKQPDKDSKSVEAFEKLIMFYDRDPEGAVALMTALKGIEKAKPAELQPEHDRSSR